MKEILTETRDDGMFLRFDPVDAKCVTVSMHRTPTSPGYKKDKSSETRKGQDQETATHLGDTVDYYVAWRALGGTTMAGDTSFEIEFC